MKEGKMKRYNGFTIAEVSMVIAIAGLIFLMTFIALPGLQMSQRDTDRRADMTKVIQEIKNYQSNNRGSLPSDSDDWNGTFKNKYLGGEKFVDPNGAEYTLIEKTCNKPNESVTTGNNCTNQDLEGLKSLEAPNYEVYIVRSASCSDETAIKSSNPRKVAVLYKLERGIFCENS